MRVDGDGLPHSTQGPHSRPGCAAHQGPLLLNTELCLNKFHITSLENLKNTLFGPSVAGLESGLPNEYNVFKSLSKLI